MDRIATKDILTQLGAGESIAELCARLQWTREQFDAFWQAECRSRVPDSAGRVSASGLSGEVRILRDSWGIPRIEAETDLDLFFGFGVATAQDRLFQLDWLRRKAQGRLAEVIGESGFESDRLYRTLDLRGVAEREWRTLPQETQDLLASYSRGINFAIETTADRPPIEFDLLDYRPEPWSPIDSLALAAEFRWYLTGRLPVIAIPEMVKRQLGDGPFYRAFLTAEADDESIMPAGSYSRRSDSGPELRPTAPTGGSETGPGSNNWVLAPSHSASGAPIVASDPHIPFSAVSWWHEVVLRGGSFRVAGASYPGMPAVMIGRSEQMAWGITNNICSLRDLYQERIDPAHPDSFLFDGRSEPAQERMEIVKVRGEADRRLAVKSSRHGPIIDDVLPAYARGTGPVSLRWVGFEPCGWLPSMLAMNRARTVEEFREAGRSWKAPTFNLVFAAKDGRIGHQCVGGIPIRDVPERGYRPGWDPRHEWRGSIPYDELPSQIDPPRGFALSANNRLVPDDYRYPVSGTWANGHRAQRIRQALESQAVWSRKDCERLQLDVHSGRAAECAGPLLALLEGADDPRIADAAKILRGWDRRMAADSVGAAIFHMIFFHWRRVVAQERLTKEHAEFASESASGLANALLRDDGESLGWFVSRSRRDAVREATARALDDLTARFGPGMAGWTWGRLHSLSQKHFLSGRGDLGTLLDRSGAPAPGDGVTVNSGTPDANHAAWLGAGYRMVADLDDPRETIRVVEVGSASGCPGSPHYDDQQELWSQGDFRELSLNSRHDPEILKILTIR